MDELFENIKNGKLRFPANLSMEVKGLLSRLLDRDVKRRLGSKGTIDIKRHDFFKKIDWTKLKRKELVVPGEMFANEEE